MAAGRGASSWRCRRTEQILGAACGADRKVRRAPAASLPACRRGADLRRWAAGTQWRMQDEREGGAETMEMLICVKI